MEKKLSEELRQCLDERKCTGCDCYDAEMVLTCKKLLQKAYERIKEYEELEEHGKLMKLPCAIGDTVYRIIPKTYRKIAELKIKEFVVCENGLCFRTDKTDFSYSCDEFGEYIFLTKEEAEAALQKMKEREGE